MVNTLGGLLTSLIYNIRAFTITCSRAAVNYPPVDWFFFLKKVEIDSSLGYLQITAKEMSLELFENKSDE